MNTPLNNLGSSQDDTTPKAQGHEADNRCDLDVPVSKKGYVQITTLNHSGQEEWRSTLHNAACLPMRLTNANDLRLDDVQSQEQDTITSPKEATQSDKELLALLDILPLDFINNAGHWDSEEATAVVGEYMTKLKSLIAEETNTARLDELERLQKLHTRTYRQTVTDNVGGVYVDDTHSYISKYETQERIASLKANKEQS